MDQLLSKKVAQLLSLEDMPEEQRTALMIRVGELAIDGALNRLLLSLTEEKVAELELYLDTHGDSENLFEYLNKQYPIFEVYLEEEILGLQEEVLTIMS